MLGSFSTCFSCCALDAAAGVSYSRSSPKPPTSAKSRAMSAETRAKTKGAGRVQRLWPHVLPLFHNLQLPYHGGSMRVLLSCMLLVLSTLGIAFGQDTNFPSGPQYLMNSGS